MALNRNRAVSQRSNSIATVYQPAIGEHSFLEPKYNSIIFNKGGGQSFWNNAGYGIDYGEWLIIPHRTFEVEAKIWGGGGGSHGSTGGAAGGGGYASGDVTFIKDIPYLIWVGESGFYSHHSQSSNQARWRYRQNTTFGNGGGGGHNGGGGGGLSGIFFDAIPTNGGPGAGFYDNATTFQTAGQATALLIAGGGGGAGHHGTSQHGQGGGGGGAQAHHGHAQSPPQQNNSGHRWESGNQGINGSAFHGGFGGNSSYTGGGGGGWYGGSGGAHTGNHHDGGSGGSGHSLELNASNGYFVNHWIKERYPTIVKSSYLETAPGNHQNHNWRSANHSDPDCNFAGMGGGNNTTDTPSTSSGRNGRVLLRLKK